MWSNQLNFIEKTRLKVAVTTASFKKTEITRIDETDLQLSMPILNSMSNFQIDEPSLSSNLCFQNSIKIFNFNLLVVPTIDDNFFELKSPEIIDLTGFAKDLWTQPLIENVNFRFGIGRNFGKSYKKEEKIKKQSDLLNENDNEKKVGDKKPKQERQFKAEDTLDLFDLIFPALQPSLGSNFNNPLTLPHPLYPFQNEGIKFLVENTSALLGDEMGLGKSIQTIVAIKVLFRQGKILNVGIICPKAVMGDWERKLWEWAPELKVIRVEGKLQDRKMIWSSKSHVYICTYETLRNDLKFTTSIRNLKITSNGHSVNCPNTQCKITLTVPYDQHNRLDISLNCPTCKHKFNYPFADDMAKTHFDLVVFDEIQKTKNSKADVTKAARILYSKYTWALSGTPLENKVEDLFTILTTIKKDIFSGIDLSNIDKIKQAYKPYFKRRRKEDVLKDLPPKITENVWLELTPNQRKAYDLAEQQGIVELEEIGETITLQHILALITKLKQICNFDPATGESTKLEYLKEKLDELTGQGDKALVFSQYVNTLKKIEPNISEYKPLVYEGRLSTNQRSDYEKRFQELSDNQVMLVSLKAGNAGITLTRANYVYHFDLWWNPAVSAQAVDRTHRIGQTKTVFETMLLSENTIERRIFNILSEKKSLFNRVVDDLSDTEDLNSLLTPDEFFGLFGLSRKKKSINPIKQEQDMNDLSPLEFEEYVAKIFNRLGYITRMTKKSHDGGIDIYAKKQTATGYENVIIQCKFKEDSNRSISVDKIHALYGVLQADKSINRAILVTNGKFSYDCERFAYGKTIELINGTKLRGLNELHRNHESTT